MNNEESPAVSDAPKPSPSLNSETSGGPSRLREHAGEVKRRGSKPGVARGPYNKEGKASKPAESVKPSIPLFNEQNTMRLIRTPFTLAAVKTSWEGFMLTEQEEREIAPSAVACCNEWVTVQPKYVAAIMLAFSLGSVVLSKTLTYLALVEAEKVRLANAKKKESPIPTDNQNVVRASDFDNKGERVGTLSPEQLERLSALTPTVPPKE